MPSPLFSWLTGAHLVGATEASCTVFSEAEEVCKSLARNHLSLIGFFLKGTGWGVGVGAAGTSGWAGGCSGRGWGTGCTCWTGRTGAGCMGLIGDCTG